ncbi:response regulator [uncultured Roseovarius sp.]|uniref:response regulator n=1 Tax=uncultured Roseovarius sp. TaxID=293344 RepID=UPI0026249C13|nr:response regulator [uncultured Roseovarius sp.]
MNEPSPHLLIVDDDERIRGLLRKFLMRHGFLVSVARDAAHARRVLAGLDFDLIVMDVMMPGESGVELTRALRETHATPILLLTAKGETSDRIEGLEAGADDYLPKPFEPKELLLRINAILRRMPEPEPEKTQPKIVRMGPVRYDIERAELSRADSPIRLTATEVQLMRIFAENLRQPVSRAKLVEDLGRGGGQAQERAVDVQITRLRRKIETDPKQPRYLQTVRGEGYMLASD